MVSACFQPTGPAAAYGVVFSMPCEGPLPAPTLGLLGQASAHMRLGEHERAIVCFDAALQRTPALSLARIGRAACLSAMGREDEAREELEACLSMGLEDGRGALVLARWAMVQGDASLAMGLVSVGLQASPQMSQTVEEDVAFRPLRDHPAFLQMVGAL